MTAYTPIANNQIDIDSPITTGLMTQLRDNPLAIQEGDVSAPRLKLFQRAIFTANGTWTRPSNITECRVLAIGGGQGGNGSTGVPGKGGHSVESILTGLSTNLTITIGAGTTPGDAVTPAAAGGDTKVSDTTPIDLIIAPGGNSGTSALGQLIVPGGAGHRGIENSSLGGGTLLGFGGQASGTTSGYGAGGGNYTGSASSGNSGIVIIYY